MSRKNRDGLLIVSVAVFLTGVGMIIWPQAMADTVIEPGYRKGRGMAWLLKQIWSIEGGLLMIALGIAIAALITLRMKAARDQGIEA